MSLIGRIVTKILGNDDPNLRPEDRYDTRNADSSTLVGRIVTKILRR
ncbi:TFIIS helical bundle-like domain containing protein [Methylobacterium sp. JK268]